MLWYIWKARNDTLFNHAKIHPKKVFAVFSALLQDFQILDGSLQVQQPTEDQKLCRQQQEMPQHPISFAGTEVQIYSDAAWNPSPHGQLQKAGLGIHIQLHQHHASNIYVAALSPPVGSPHRPKLTVWCWRSRWLKLYNSTMLTSSRIRRCLPRLLSLIEMQQKDLGKSRRLYPKSELLPVFIQTCYHIYPGHTM